MAQNTGDRDPDAIEVSEVLPEEIPAELLDRVSEHYPHLQGCELQVKRNGWKLIRSGKRSFGSAKPNVYDLCAFLVRTAKLDAEHQGGETTRYRARLVCKQGDQIYHRYASVRGVIDDEGALQIVDDDKGDEDGVLKTLLEATKQAQGQCFQALNVVIATCKGFADIANSFSVVLGTAGQQWAQHNSNQVELLKVQMSMEQNSQAHQERMKKYDRGFALLEGPVGRLGDEIVGFAVDSMRAKRQQQRRERHTTRNTNGNGAAHRKPETRCAPADQLEGIFEDLDEVKQRAVQNAMSDDEWKLIQVARRAQNDAEFDAAFARFLEILKQRGSDGVSAWIQKLVPIVGPQSVIDLGMLIKRIERPEENDSPPAG